jgi:hypothetical protein
MPGGLPENGFWGWSLFALWRNKLRGGRIFLAKIISFLSCWMGTFLLREKTIIIARTYSMVKEQSFQKRGNIW